MSVQQIGQPPSAMLPDRAALDALLERAADAHAAAIVTVAGTLGYVHRVERTVRYEGVGKRAIIDSGAPMTWLAGKRVPLTGILDRNGKQAIRTVTAAALASGHWRYPGRVSLMADADQSPEVRAVVAEYTGFIREARS